MMLSEARKEICFTGQCISWRENSGVKLPFLSQVAVRAHGGKPVELRGGNPNCGSSSAGSKTSRSEMMPTVGCQSMRSV